MGGRLGNYSGYANSGSARTESYETVYNESSSNIEFITGNSSANRSAPIFSNSPDKIYVNLHPNGRIESITKYVNHKEVWSIHLGHGTKHNDVHSHSPRKLGGGRKTSNLSDEQRKIYNQVVKLYNQNVKKK